MASSWLIFKSQFAHNRHFISTEAPFQHYFANIIRQVGDLYCLTREDVFLIDLETQCKHIKGKTKYLDITCEFVNNISCAIELKFKKASQGAQDHGRIDIYSDIQALELVCEDRFSVGKFYAITDSKPYVNKSKRGVGTVFPTHNGYISEADKEYLILNCNPKYWEIDEFLETDEVYSSWAITDWQKDFFEKRQYAVIRVGKDTRTKKEKK